MPSQFGGRERPTLRKTFSEGRYSGEVRRRVWCDSGRDGGGIPYGGIFNARGKFVRQSGRRGVFNIVVDDYPDLGIPRCEEKGGTVVENSQSSLASGKVDGCVSSLCNPTAAILSAANGDVGRREIKNVIPPPTLSIRTLEKEATGTRIESVNCLTKYPFPIETDVDDNKEEPIEDTSANPNVGIGSRKIYWRV